MLPLGREEYNVFVKCKTICEIIDINRGFLINDLREDLKECVKNSYRLTLSNSQDN
jgi:hypothetical protein